MTFPVALFGYRRPDLMANMIAGLLRNPQIVDTEVFVFCDGTSSSEHHDAVQAVRSLCRSIEGVGALHLCFREQNMGCAINIIEGVSQVLRKHSAVIVLEDDLLVSPCFLGYMNKSLAVFEDRPDIYSISAFSPSPEQIGLPIDSESDVYLSRRNASWGWGTWSDRWAAVDWNMTEYPAFSSDHERRQRFNLGGNDLAEMLDAQMSGQIDSWSIRFTFAHFMQDAYSLCPYWSYTDHVGTDGSGTHVKTDTGIEIMLDRALSEPRLPPDLQPVPEILEKIEKFHSEPGLSVFLRRIPGVRALVRTVKKYMGIRGRLL